MKPTNEQIAARAYERWQARGETHGQHEADWLEAERELTPVSVVLLSAGLNRIAVVKEVRTITGLDLHQAHALLDELPSTLKPMASLAEAEAIRARMAAVGSIVEVLAQPQPPLGR